MPVSLIKLIKIYWKYKQERINMGSSEKIKAAIEWLKKQGYEKIQAPILMFSTGADTIWPSKESCETMEEAK